MNREQPKTPAFEGEPDIAKIENFIEGVSSRYRDEGIPLGHNGRIDMAAYKKLYFDAEKDIIWSREWEREWFGNVPEAEAQEKRRRTEGEQLEMLAYAVFTKNLGERFVVARSSPHDDRTNKVDTVILDRATGNLVCAFDEVGATSGADFEKKQNLVQEHNLKGGASLKYGIGIDEREKNGKVILSSADRLPLFYIALPPDRIKKGLKEFIPDPVNQSDFEKKLFAYFVAAISAQITALELYSKRLNPDLKKKLDGFRDVMDTLSMRQGS